MKRSAAPTPTYRLIPSRFPPINLFDTVATAADLEAAMELAGWTNDRIVAERLHRLPESEWVHGRTNSSVIMASFLHVAPGGSRFNGPDLGAWYAAQELITAVIEVAHHMRRECVATDSANLSRTFRAYTAKLEGKFVDIRGQETTHKSLYDSSDYSGAQTFGEEMRAAGEDGILFDSIRHVDGVNIAAFRPSKILDVTQTDHYEVSVEAASSKIGLRKLNR